MDVRDGLRRAGIPLVAQYGASGYRVDFAAKHPTQPGRMVLAIECDGAAYHSSVSARDRDRLRQEHLERLGWRFHHIWSQDWYTDKRSEIAKAKSAYQTAVQTAEIAPAEIGTPRVASSRSLDDGDRPSQTANAVSDNRSGGRHSRGPRPITVGRLGIEEYSHAELAELIQWIESDTLLRLKEQLIDEAMRELGFQRRGRMIIAAIEQAIESTRRRGVS